MLALASFDHLTSLPWLAVPFCFIAFLAVQAILSSVIEAHKRGQRKCGKIPSIRQWDPVFGLDLVWSQYQALKHQTFIPWLRAMHEGRPKTFKVKFLGKRQIFTSDPENLKHMTAIVWKDFGISPLRRYKNIGHPFADKGVNTTDGEDWAFSRFLIKPFFYREVYTDIERVRHYTDEMLTLVPPDGETFNIQPLIQRWFLDATTHFIFGAPMGALPHPERAKVTWAMLDVLRGARLRLQLWRIQALLNWNWWFDAVKVVHEFVDVHIDKAYADLEARRKAIESGQDAGPERTDLLWYMASNCPDREELRSQVSLLFVPNNDTTSIFTSNVIWNLARHPECWAKVRAEVLAHGDKPITFEALRQMKYVQAVLNETHRLYSNNITQVRVCLSDTTLPRGGGPGGDQPIFVRKGDMVQVAKPVLQRDPEYWGDDAEAFRPERFEEKAHFWEFVPFSGGPRRCPAQMMVMTESAYMVVRLAQIYARVEARDENPYHSVIRIGPSNRTGVLIALHKQG
ncbi:putative monooxygenase [Biscogniauxia mediterranea]|nr:putative monooxygenase [Biscogniauxia mediterranea]